MGKTFSVSSLFWLATAVSIYLAWFQAGWLFVASGSGSLSFSEPVAWGLLFICLYPTSVSLNALLACRILGRLRKRSKSETLGREREYFRKLCFWTMPIYLFWAMVTLHLCASQFFGERQTLGEMILAISAAALLLGSLVSSVRLLVLRDPVVATRTELGPALILLLGFPSLTSSCRLPSPYWQPSFRPRCKRSFPLSLAVCCKSRFNLAKFAG